jgi:spermidine/putrescine transport system permease protein
MNRPVLLTLPALLVTAGLFLAPMLLLFAVSFWVKAGFTLRPGFTLAAWGDAVAIYGRMALWTLGVGLVIGTLCTALGLVFAYGAAFKAGRHGDRLILAVLVTLFGGYLAKIYAWKSILGATGLLNGALMGLGLTTGPVAALIYSPVSVVIALTHFLLPFAILPIYASLRAIDRTGIEAAADLGARPAAIVLRVILPQAAPGLFAAFAFSFLLAAGDYVTPLLIGGPSANMLGQFVLEEFSARFNWPLGAAMSFGLLALCLAVLTLVGRAGRAAVRRLGGPA